MSRLAPILLAALLAAPLAQADAPVAITIATLREGDRLHFVEHTMNVEMRFVERGVEVRGRPVTWSHVILVEGAGTVDDKFGIPRAVETFREDVTEDGEVVAASRCHAVPGGNASVLVEPLVSPAWSQFRSSGRSRLGFVTLDERQTEGSTTPVADYSGAPCPGQGILHGVTLREGDRPRLGDLIPTREGHDADLVSEPLARSTFHGRAALLARFDVPRGDGPASTISLLFADGLPGVVNQTIVGATWHDEDGDRHSYTATMELVGFDAGSGAPLAPHSRAAYDGVNPAGRFGKVDPLRFDDAPFALPFPYDAAFAQLKADPRSGLADYLAAHPDASLKMAYYAQTADPMGTPATDSDGFWMLTFADASSVFTGTTHREALAAGPARLPLPADPLFTGGSARPESFFASPGATTLAATRDAADLTRRAGLDPSRVASLTYVNSGDMGNGPIAFLEASDGPRDPRAPRSESRMVAVDLVSGGLSYVASTRVQSERSGLLAPPAGTVGIEQDRDGFGALSALIGPVGGLGIAEGAAATATLGALVLLAKFLLFPLFTRLRRASLLDNPVRARLYDRVRAEPGIRQAELVDFAGVGRSPTARHLAQLVRHGFIVEIGAAGATGYYAAGEVPPEVARREAILRAGRLRDVYDLHQAAPRISLREAGAKLGMSAPSVHRARKKLEKAGLIGGAR